MENPTTTTNTTNPPPSNTTNPPPPANTTDTTITNLTCLTTLPPTTTPPKPTTMGMNIAWHITWSPNGKLLASCHGSPDHFIRLYKLDYLPSNKKQLEFTLLTTLKGVHERTIRCIEFSPDSKLLASASFDGSIAIWEQDDEDGEWECTAQLEGHENEVKCVTWNGSGTLLASCGRDKSVWIWECLSSGGGSGEYGEEEFECVAVLHGHQGDVKCVAFANSNGQWGDGDDILLSASYDDTIKCWAEDAGDWYCAATLSAHSSTVWCVAPAPGGVRFLSASDDCSLAIWKCYTAKEKRDKFPDEDFGSNTGGAWKCVGKLPSAHKKPIYSVHCAPSRAGHGRIVSGSGDDCIQIYREVNDNSSSDAPLFTLEVRMRKAHDGDVNCVRWHPFDGSLLASVGDDGLVKVWRYVLN